MKKLDLGQTIGILANLGVIAGIVFLGYKLRQNNLLLRFESDIRVLEKNTQTASDIVEAVVSQLRPRAILVL